MGQPNFAALATVYDIATEDGASYVQGFVYKTLADPLDPDSGTPVDLTGCTARLVVQEQLGEGAALLTLTSPSGGLSLGTTDGGVSIEATPAQTRALYDLDVTSAFYVLELTWTSGPHSGRTKRLLQGKWTTRAGATSAP